MPTLQTINIRLLRDDERDKVLDLLNDTFEQNFSRDWWRWKYIDNPHGQPLCLVAERNGNLVGLRAFISRQWMSIDGISTFHQAVDTAVHPSAQRQGVFTALTQAALKRLEVCHSKGVFNFPNPKSLPGYMKMGWTFVRKIRFWCSVSFSRNEYTVAKSNNAFTTEGSSKPHSFSFLRFLRDEDYLRWRYQNHPNFIYQIWQLGKFKGQDGFAITRVIRKNSLPILMLIDLCGGIATENVDQREALFHFKKKVGYKMSLPLVVLESTFGCRPKDYISAAFIRVPKKGANFTIRKVPGTTTGPLHEMLVTPGDIDTF